MSKIDKLTISGVRSFGPMNRQLIQFHTPLTLIVGYNGSGKTTIIECLKYATTGEQPPNSRGGAFIHDPSLCGEREVLAQVRLQFHTPPDTQCSVARSIQLTVKKTTRTSKTLESTFVTKRLGERNTQSSKNVDIDSLVPRNLGVPAAILDAVIFCHQDESLWPMSEPTALKKRFDEIFEAQKYTKAIDNLKVMRKQYGEVLKTKKYQEGQDKETKEKADKCQQLCIQLQDEIEELRRDCDEIAIRMAQATNNARAKHEQANSFLDIVNELKNKQHQLEIRKENVEELRDSIDELGESDQWLQETLAQYEAKVERYEAEHEANKLQYSEHQKELAKTRRNLDAKLSEQGKHQSDKEKYERHLESRVELIHQAAQLHEIRGFDGDLEDAQVKQFGERMQKLLNDKKRELDHLTKENHEEQDKKTAVVTGLEGRKSSRTQERHNARQRIGALEKRSNAVQNQLNSVDIDEGAKAVLDASYQDAEQRLQKASEDFQSSGIDAKLRQENDNLVKLEAENDSLGREMMECTRLATDRAQLDLRKKELSDKKRDLDRLTTSWTDKISALVGKSWKPESVDRDFQQVLQEKTKALDEVTRKRDDTMQNLKQVQFTLSTAKDKAKKRDDELERCKTAVRDALKEVDSESTPNVDNLPKEIEDLEEDILKMEKDVSLFDEMKEFYLNCQKTMNKSNKCVLCDRLFGSAGEKSKLAQKIKEGLDDNKKEESKKDLTLCEEQLGILRLVRPQYDTYSRLSSEKPELDQELQASKDKEEGILKKLEEMDQVVRDKSEERQDVEYLSKPVSEISRAHRDIVEAETQVDRIMSQQQSGGLTRSPDEIRELQESCTDKMRSVKSKINKYQGDKQQKIGLINQLELEKSRLSNKVSNAAQQLERRKDFQNQMQAVRDEMATQRQTIQQADKDLETIEPEMAKARAIREDIIQRGRAKEKKVAEERDELSGSLSELKMVESDIRDYLERGGPSNLAANDRAIQTLNKAVDRTEKDMNELAARTNKLKDEISDSARKKKNISDNLNYRKNIRQIDALKSDIAQLESRNATEDYDRLMNEAQSIEIQRDKMTAERGVMVGAMKTKDEELNRQTKDWDDGYHNAALNYRRSHIEVETTKAAIEDLGRYSDALDNAIMRYHTLKMDEVNRIAGALWRETYQGTDIDNILIRSDRDTGSTGVRRYNYRVCMVKQDTEMDMRGRCSAGQKVLACIIIRLALAESFGTNCGLIALDEPTTNLDSDNIRSLAENLHKIIRDRQGQRNFQLIIITHDEEFLRHMRCSDFCDTFYRVKRDASQNSIIRSESITTICD
jgi:DNA repair protein RAD50